MMIQRNEMDQETKRLGLVLDDQYVMEQIAKHPRFRTTDGKFNRQLWESLLRQYGKSEHQFLEGERMEETRATALGGIIANKQIPHTLLDNLYRARGQKRFLEVLSITNASVNNVSAPAADALKDYHDKHSDLFTAPEYRALTIAKLSVTDIAKDVTINEDDLKKAYETKQVDLMQPETRDLVQVVLQDEVKAKAIAEAAQKEGDLTAAAKSKGNNTVPISRAEQKSAALPDLYKAIFALKDKEVSAPVKTSLGWHVVQVKKIYPATTPTYAELKDKLRVMLQHDMSVEAMTRIVNQMDDALAANRSLEEIADSLKLRMIKIPAVSDKGLTPENKAPVELPAKTELLKTAFGLSSNETSSILEDKNDTGSDYVVVRVDEVVPSHVRPLDEVKEQVTTAWRADEQAKQAALQAEKIAQTVRDGKTMSGIALKPGYEMHISKPISLLGDTDKDLPQTVLPQIFKMQPGDVITAGDKTQQFVLRLARLEDVDPAHQEGSYQKLVKDMNEQMPYEMLEQYYRQIRRTFPVTINQDLLDFMKKQGS